MKRISVDIGGTFTDCFFVWNDKHIEAKALTTHHNLALGFNEALDLACSRADLDREEVLSRRRLGPLRDHPRDERTHRAQRSQGRRLWSPTASRTRFRSRVAAATAKASIRPCSRTCRPRSARSRWYHRKLIRSVRERVNSAGKVVVPLDENHVRRRCVNSSTTAQKPSSCP